MTIEMSRHEGVSCDACSKGNFRGRRYKCLICYDYDLCEECYEAGAMNARHTADHPVQCILTRADYDLFYAGEAITNVDQPLAYTCPYCARMGFTELSLLDHVTSDHSDTSFEVVCPVCAAMPGGDPNYMTDDFSGHLTLEHRSGARDLISLLDEPSGGARHSVRRVGHSAHLHTGRGAQSSRPRRSNMHFSVFSTAGLSSLSPSSREPVDPIAELLSQLSGVRRSTSNTGSTSSSTIPNQLQQLRMHLQLERQQVSAARQQLERLPRRINQSQTTLSENSSSSSNSMPGYHLLMNPNSTQSQPPATAPPVPSPPTKSLLEELLEELSSLYTDDENYSDRYKFADNLLLGTLTAMATNNAESDEIDGDNDNDLTQTSASVLSVATESHLPTTQQQSSALSSSTNSKPVPTQTRVLRGRARSDGHNALRRADANKATNVQEYKKGGTGTASKAAVSR